MSHQWEIFHVQRLILLTLFWWVRWLRPDELRNFGNLTIHLTKSSLYSSEEAYTATTVWRLLSMLVMHCCGVASHSSTSIFSSQPAWLCLLCCSPSTDKLMNHAFKKLRLGLLWGHSIHSIPKLCRFLRNWPCCAGLSVVLLGGRIRPTHLICQGIRCHLHTKLSVRCPLDGFTIV